MRTVLFLSLSADGNEYSELTPTMDKIINSFTLENTTQQVSDSELKKI